jgi:hypothetical protein
MIASLQNLSIRHKLRLMLCTALATALLMACFAFVALEFGEQREVENARNATLAEVMTANLAPALVFQRADAAVETLSALRARKDIQAAAVYRTDGNRLAYFSRDPHAPPPKQPPRDGAYERGGQRIAVTPVQLGQERVGTLYLQSQQARVADVLLKKSLLTLVVLVVCSVIALMIGDALSTAISRPILSLVWSRPPARSRSARTREFAPRSTRTTSSVCSSTASTRCSSGSSETPNSAAGTKSCASRTRVSRRWHRPAHSSSRI